MAARESQDEGTTSDHPILISGLKRPKVIYSDPSVGKRSHIYSLYTWNELANKFTCNNCKKEFTQVISTLRNHIERKHPISLKNLTSSAQATGGSELLKKTFTPTEKREPLTKDGVEKRLINFIIVSAQPFSLVEERGFRKFIEYVAQGHQHVQLPSARTVRRRISQLYCEKKNYLREHLKTNEGKISFAVDCWTSSNQLPFQGVVGTWIDSEWNMVTRVIDLTILEGNHTGENIAAAFSEVLKEFDIWPRLHCIVTDNASNMDTFFEKMDQYSVSYNSSFNSKDFRIRCLAHVMNLACKAIMKSAESYDPDLPQPDEKSSDDESDNEWEAENKNGFINRLRNSVRKVRSSPQRREAFKNHCINLKIDQKNLILDVQTRWNFSLKMFERCKELRRPLEITIQNIPKLRRYSLSSEEWEKIDGLIHILTPFREATEILSITHSPTVSHTSAVYQVLFDHLEKYTEIPTGRTLSNSRNTTTDANTWLVASAGHGLEKLKKYYPSTDGLAYWASTVLDPRYKLTWYKQVGWRKEWVDAARKGVIDCWSLNYKPTASLINPVNNVDTPAGSSRTFQSLLAKQMKGADRLVKEDELKRYLAVPVVSSDRLTEQVGINGVLGWWKIYQSEYPNLSRMARDFLAVPGTGVPVERLFSTGAELLSPYRQRLNAQSIKEMICLKNWLIANDDKVYSNSLKSALVHKLLGEADDDDSECDLT